MTVSTVTGQIALRPQDLALLAEADPNGVAASTSDNEITNLQLDRWSTELARLIRELGGTPHSPVVVALAPSIESVVAAWALAKVEADSTSTTESVPGATIGITTRNRRFDLSASINWLILDEPATMRRYLTTDDAALEAANVAA